MDEDKLLTEKKEKLITFFKRNYNWITYALLAVIAYMACYIRTRPMMLNSATGKPGLWDISTNSWTLGPDLDPFLFLRWAKYIVTHGSLFAIDTMRYAPLGLDSKVELILHPYMIAWFHNFLNFFGLTSSVTYSAILYPVFFFVLTIIAFFLMTREIFSSITGLKQANAIALIASFFLSVMPSLLARTIAGIPEKESVGFFFIFLTFYLFLKAWKSKTYYAYLLAVLAAISTTAMALVWGGYVYIMISISLALLISFILGNVKNKETAIFAIWLVGSFFLMSFFSVRYTFSNFITSTTTAIPIFILVILLVHLLIFNTKIKSYVVKGRLSKIPPALLSIIITFLISLLAVSIMAGPDFIVYTLKDVTAPFISPTTSRFGVTVAENRQPFFNEWANSFGPVYNGIPIFFWLFFVGSVFLFYVLTSIMQKKERTYLTAAYIFFLIAMIFSRYKSDSTFNGTNNASILFYFVGIVTLVFVLGYYYYTYFKKDELSVFSKLNFGGIILFSFFFFSVVSARGSVRTIMVLVPTAAIMGAYLLVHLFDMNLKEKDKNKKLFFGALTLLVALLVLFSGYNFYNESKQTALSYIPSSYTQQWQNAMGWVRENTPQNAVFGHWWDYGYWLQSMGERATVLDGGNAIVYWDHLMGRYGLTSPSEKETFEFLYTHNTTHFLIDSSDIGKYGAFSSIGSNEFFDRVSFIPTFQKYNAQTKETKNSTIDMYIYSISNNQLVGIPIEDDFVFSNNQTNVTFFKGTAFITAISIERNSAGDIISPPMAQIFQKTNQYLVPMQYAYQTQNGLLDFGKGMDAGVFVYPRAQVNSNQLQLEPDGALLYLSNRTVKSQLAKIYLYDLNNTGFDLVHVEDDAVVASIKAQNPGYNYDFIEYNGFRGPIKIWEIHYPAGVMADAKYLDTNYPKNLTTSQ